jgi:NADPH:quinone reductase-like Zn-dependent oxidoreductase
MTGESIAFAKPPTYALELRNRGHVVSISVGQSPAPVPGPGQVAIAVRAVGLNYLDVLLARGVIGEDAVPGFVGGRLGADCAGVASGVGPGVSGLVPGDRVCAFAPGSFASNVVLLSVAQQAMIPRLVGRRSAISFAGKLRLVFKGMLLHPESLLSSTRCAALPRSELFLALRSGHTAGKKR